MSGVKQFHHSKVAHKPLRSFTQNILMPLSKVESDPFIQRSVPILNGYIEELDKGFHRERRNAHTIPLNQLDDRRDLCLMAIKKTLEASQAEAFINAKRGEAADRILIEYSKMGTNVVRQGYQRESASVNSFLVAAAILEEEKQLSRTAHLFELLADTQAQFDEQVGEKNSEDTQGEDIRGIVDVRIDLTNRLDSILNYLDTSVNDMPDMYGSVVNEINRIIGDTMATAKAEASRGAN